MPHPLARLSDLSKPTLWFIHASGCPACAAMKPVVRRWLRAHPGLVVPRALDLASVEWKAKAWEPELTPTCLVRYPGGKLAPVRLDGHEGYAVFDAFMRTALARR